jgi:hypothetical protein
LGTAAGRRKPEADNKFHFRQNLRFQLVPGR